MLQRLRSRHPIDLPRGPWRHKRGILYILGGLAALFVLIPFVVSPLVTASQSTTKALVAVGAGVGTLVLVLLVTGIMGKPGWDR